ncbi:MAG: uL15m family ribosomal protein [Promethearchaeota archaeon]
MVIRKRHKIRKMRRNRVCGYGRVSGGHRKSGQRGGVGGAGRKDHKKHWYTVQGIVKQGGFTRLPLEHPSQTVNVGFLNEQADKLAAKEANIYKIDLNALGIGKLLGTGKINKKLHITVDSASKRAIEKIEGSGGKVTLPEEDK